MILATGSCSAGCLSILGVELKKKVDAQVIDEVGSSTIMSCGFDLIRAGDYSDEQGVQTPIPPVSRRTPS